MKLSEEKDALQYRAILNHYGCIEIAKVLSDDAIYDLMYTINWMGGKEYSAYYSEYRSAEKDEEKLKALKERYVERTRSLLKASGYDEKQIEEMISAGFAKRIMNLHCWPGLLQPMFNDKFGSKDVLEKYIKELAEDRKKITPDEIGQAVIGASINTKQAVEAVETAADRDADKNKKEPEEGQIE